jgi:hypothetical protein
MEVTGSMLILFVEKAAKIGNVVFFLNSGNKLHILFTEILHYNK